MEGRGQVAITIPVKDLEPTNSEAEYKAKCEAHEIICEILEVREELDKRMEASILENEINRRRN